MVRALHELDEHLSGEFIGLVTGGDADYGELLRFGGARRIRRSSYSVGVYFLFVVGEFGYEFADAEEEKIAAGIVEVSLVAVLFDQ